jgi:hypothetical protein
VGALLGALVVRGILHQTLAVLHNFPSMVEVTLLVLVVEVALMGLEVQVVLVDLEVVVVVGVALLLGGFHLVELDRVHPEVLGSLVFLNNSQPLYRLFPLSKNLHPSWRQ